MPSQKEMYCFLSFRNLDDYQSRYVYVGLPNKVDPHGSLEAGRYVFHRQFCIHFPYLRVMLEAVQKHQFFLGDAL